MTGLRTELRIHPRTDLKLALMQCDSWPGDVAGNLQRLDRAAMAAAATGADLLVTPEMFLTGYNIGHAAAVALAEPTDGARVDSVAAIARRHRIAIVFGHPERGADDRIFNAAVCIGDDGAVLATYRKTHLFGDLDHGMFSSGAGDEPLCELHGWKVGLLICFDVEFPENTRRLASMGAQLIVVPTANMAGFEFVSRHLVPTRAYENRVFVAYANYCGAEHDLTYNGLSCAVAPNGDVLAQAGIDPCTLTADVTWAGWCAGQALDRQGGRAGQRRDRGEP